MLFKKVLEMLRDQDVGSLIRRDLFPSRRYSVTRIAIGTAQPQAKIPREITIL
jgi:hypothetical protein